ncbi:VOC family protein [Sphingopyxis sp. MWB1]|uniref:VOC family protein n=1 Tax=Sphingopyxis sp. MWB1 TaxID=1537715 RepID=UPI00051A34F3|nr:VOC family protein [Sphingopyxis sp. MWB1]
MAAPFIEHVNLTVSDPDRTADLLQRIFGWRERWRGPARDNGRTIHLGSDNAYIALYAEADANGSPARWPKGAPFNHVGIVVEDLGAVEARVKAAGLIPFNHGDYEPGRRFYFMDPDDIEFEVVSYAPAPQG